MRQSLSLYVEFLVLISLVTVFGVATHQRNLAWKDDFSLWQDVVKKSPNKARPYIWLGLAYQRKGLVDEAIARFHKALTLEPNHADTADTYNNLGLCCFDKGWPGLAIKHFEHAIRIAPNHIHAHNNLGFIYLQMKRYREAMNEFKAILRVDPHNKMAKRLVILCQRNLIQDRPRND
ncbi:MAG: tetratricopeptide repeat protein [Desulfobacterales bacterium]|nr:tetratricopeptide repeat protein [Desulfobacterales bacterium]